MTHALAEQLAGLPARLSCQVGARVSRFCYESLPRLANGTRGATVGSPATTITLVVVAALIGVIAALIVGYLVYDGQHPRKAILSGVLAFGGTMAGVITIEHDVGLI
jgi:hypothetical protein